RREDRSQLLLRRRTNQEHRLRPRRLKLAIVARTKRGKISCMRSVIAVLLASCAGTSPTTPGAGTGSGSASAMTHDVEASFQRDVGLKPTDKLLAWLESQTRDGEPLLMRLPFVLAQGVTGFGTSRATIGVSPDALSVFLDDTALGIGIADRARKCQG